MRQLLFLSLFSFIFINSPSSAYTDFGHFLTGILVVAGLALPLVLSHAHIIAPAACWMSIAGGVLIYGTILVYAGAFGSGEEDY